MAGSEFTVRVSISTGEIAGLVKSADVQHGIDELAEAGLTLQKALVPVDTGKLSRSLDIRKTSDGVGREIGSFGVDYAAAVEEGHHTKSGKFVPGQPYIRPSIDAIRRRLSNGR